MNITFYNTVITENNIRDRNVSNGTTLSCTYRIGNKGVQELAISMISVTVPTYNYCYITDLGKYYFLEAPIKGDGTNEWLYVAKEDPLFTLWNSFKSQEAFIERCETGYNPDMIDNIVPYENDTFTVVKKLTGSKSFNTSVNIALINQGGAMSNASS